MSTYKVLQDIEAEDTIVGPLTLRQLIYALISAVCLYICFLAVTRGAAFMLVLFLPVAGITGFFAFPWKGEQPTEIWALARLRFMVLPRNRIWNQSGIKEVVTITVPRTAPVQVQRRSLSQNEVRSRLKALADTIDTRGWATRNANFQYYVNAAGQGRPPSDRLVNASGLQPGSIPADAFLPSNDMLDDHNPIAQNLDALLNKSSANQRQRVIQQMAQVTQLSSAGPPVSQAQIQPMQRPQQLPQLPAPAMPTASLPQTIPAPTPQPIAAPQQFSVPPSDHWFLNPPGHPTAQPAAAPQAPQVQQTQPIQQPGPQLPRVAIAVPAQSVPTQPSQPAPQVWQDQSYQQDQQVLTAAQFRNQAAAQPAQDSFAYTVSPSDVLGSVPAAEPTAAEQAMAQTMIQQNKSVMKVNYNHMRVLQPATDSDLTVSDDIIQRGNNTTLGGPGGPLGPVTRKPDPAILELANNDDLDVATIARQANREMNKSPDEVEIRLH